QLYKAVAKNNSDEIAKYQRGALPGLGGSLADVFSSAVRLRDLEVMEEVYAKVPTLNINAFDRTGNTPLMHAIQARNLSMVKWLMEQRKNNNQPVVDYFVENKKKESAFALAQGLPSDSPVRSEVLGLRAFLVDTQAYNVGIPKDLTRLIVGYDSGADDLLPKPQPPSNSPLSELD